MSLMHYLYRITQWRSGLLCEVHDEIHWGQGMSVYHYKLVSLTENNILFMKPLLLGIHEYNFNTMCIMFSWRLVAVHFLGSTFAVWIRNVGIYLLPTSRQCYVFFCCLFVCKQAGVGLLFCLSVSLSACQQYHSKCYYDGAIYLDLDFSGLWPLQNHILGHNSATI